MGYNFLIVVIGSIFIYSMFAYVDYERKNIERVRAQRMSLKEFIQRERVRE